MKNLLIIGDGSLLKGILVLLFAVNGLILVILGAVANLDRLAEKHPNAKGWQASTYFAILILSYLALLDAITKLL